MPKQPARTGAIQLTPANYLKGAACGFAAVSIWASWSVVTRLAVTTSLDASDIVALRFGVAGLLLSPVLVRRGLARDRLGWLGLAVLIAGLGAPYALTAANGLRFAPAYDGGALNPGCMPLFVALIAAIALGETLAAARKLGLSLILAGAVILIGWHTAAASATWSASRSFGDALFLVASFLTACGTVVMRRAKLDPLHAAALVSTGSLAVYLPVYLALSGTRLAQMPLADFAYQAVFQGVVVTIIALILYGRAVAVLGASGSAAFGALVPALSALFAIPLLGEWPNEAGWAGIVLISAGVYLASGGPLPGRKPRESHLPALTPLRTSELVLTGTCGPNRNRDRRTP
ncbi:MAG TPA: DMT family transporter [Stellaceae bacterium]|nr:DMT family transporter [Stellaceae bacterium]